MGDENATSVKVFILVGFSSDRRTQLLLFVVVLIIYSLIIVGNLAIILLVWVESSLHTPMYFFLSNLAGLEICYVTTTLPQTMASLVSGSGVISFSRCMAQMYITLFFGATECLILTVMAYDRYLAICHPLIYTSVMGRGQQFLLASVTWVGGFLLGSLMGGSAISLSFCGPNRIDHFTCEMAMIIKLSCTDTYITQVAVLLAALFAIIIPLSIIMTSYGFVISSVLKMRSTAGWHKAFSTCGSHLIVVTLFYGTVIFMYVIPRSGSTSDRDKKIAIFYLMVTPLLNPIIYTLRNKDIHDAIAKVLQRLDIKQKS